MKSQYSQVFEFVKQTESIAQKHQLPTPLLISEIKQESDNSVLNIMLYGAYNAGKSTLINVLSGSQVAPTADIPKTDKVDRYQWNDYVLLDTPGVNAPIQHEEVTLEQLTRCSTILFVIRDGDMDSKDVYVRLFDLLNKDKKIFIVLNNQLVTQHDKKQAADYIRQILVNLSYEYNTNLEKLGEIEIIPMNLHTALSGLEKNHEKLLAHSGYTNFIERFNNWVSQQNGERQRFNGFKNFVNERWFIPLLEKIINSKPAQDQEKLRSLLDEKNELAERKNILFNRISDVIRTQATSNKSVLAATLQNCHDKFQIECEMNQIFQNMSSKVEQVMQKELENFNFYFDFDSNDIIPADSLPSTNQITDKMIDLGKNLLTDEKVLKNGLLLGRQLKIPLLKGRWEKTLGNWAGKAAGVLQVASAIYDIYASQKEEDERNAQQRRAMLELHQAIDNICTDFVNNAYQAVEQAIYPIFDRKIAEIQNQLEALKSENIALDEDLNKVTQSQTAMLAIQW